MNITTQTTTASGITARVPTSSLEAATPSRTTRPTGNTAPVTDTPTASQEPVLRFPWLNRVSRELETVAKQKPPFTSATPLGDHLDSSA